MRYPWLASLARVISGGVLLTILLPSGTDFWTGVALFLSLAVFSESSYYIARWDRRKRFEP